MTNENNPLPIMLQYFRKKKKLTQQEIADMLSISRASYASYESGRIIPRFEQIVKLSKILDHDFLFAYTVSYETQLNENPAYAEYVYEETSYNATGKKEDPLTADELSLSVQSSFDKELMKVYNILRAKGELNENC